MTITITITTLILNVSRAVWRKLKDTRSGQFYYLNTLTNKVGGCLSPVHLGWMPVSSAFGAEYETETVLQACSCVATYHHYLTLTTSLPKHPAITTYLP